MENRINTKIVITVSKNKKLLSCLRKLDSGEAASVNVEINYAYKKKPIKLSFLKIKTPTKTSDDFLVYAEYRSSKSSSKVILGNASIKNIEESGFVSIGNKEAKECVIINTYSKNDSADFRELKKVLLDTMELEDYTPSNCTPHKDFTNSTILIELKPENSKIISYEVSMLPPVKTKQSTKENMIKGKAQEHSTNPSISQDDSSLKEDTNSSAVKEKITTMASFVFSRDAYKYAKKLNKILSAGEIDIQADSFTKIGKISSFKSGIDIKSNNHIVVAVSEIDEQIATDCYNRHKSSQFAVALFGYQDYIRNMTIGAISKRLFEVKQNKIARKNLSRALKTTTEGIPPIRKRYMVKEEKSPISHLESLLEKNQKTSNQNRGKDLINIIAESLREIESIGKANVSKNSKAAATEDLFCKKTKANSKKNDSTTQPYQALNPLVTILASDESKNKVKEIIEEANRTKSFPYKLDYNNNCVIKISDNLFDILECRNKLEDILKIRKDIDVGVFNLEHTGNLVLKKLFNISSLTVYHSASKNLYALIGA